MIELKGLTKSFNGFTAVDRIDLKIGQGDIFGLLGPNGAGKSTTISMISTLLKPTAGTILYKGTDVVKQPQLIRSRIGFVPQEIALFESLSGLDNLKFWGSAYGLKGAALQHRIAAVSEIIGIKKRLASSVASYSGGMKRRLNIGVALLHEPELLIMDEPTVGIDPQSRNHILETVKQLNRAGVSLIYTSHYMEEIEAICSDIAIMDRGKIIAHGSKDQLIAQIGQSSRIVLKLAADCPQLVALLRARNDVVEVAVGSAELTINCRRSTLVAAVLEAAAQCGCEVRDVGVEQPDLESLFLNLTGKSLRD